MKRSGDHARFCRRRFLQAGVAAAMAASAPRLLFARSGGDARLVVVILRGALDGLAAVPPHADPGYASLRAELAIPPPGAGGALDLDGFFGLHPALQFLHERHAAGELRVFHAVASPYRERSHFDGQAVLENGLARPLGSADGWLNRTLAALPAASAGRGTSRAVALNQNLPLILRGGSAALSKAPGAAADVDEELMGRLADLYSTDDWFSARLSEALQTEKLTEDAVAPTAGADRLAQAAAMAAAILAGRDGPQIAVLEAGGWDTHANQGGVTGTLATRLQRLDQSLRTLAAGLPALWSQTAVLIVTEFGRTAAINGTRGTDHGIGTCAFLVGGAVRGGRVVADWPGLSRGALFEGRDLRPTTDLRRVFKGVLAGHLGVGRDILETRIFPDSAGAPAFEGLIRS